MANFLQLLISGLGIGAIYALVALGFVLIYRAANVVNFAQGQIAMVGAFFLVVAVIDWHLNVWIAFLLALIGMAVFGVLFELGVYYPLRNQSFLPVIISTIAASILLQNLAQYIFGANPISVPSLFAAQTIKIGSIIISVQYLVILVATAIFVAFQYLVLDRSMLGKKMEATAQDKDTARLLGIPVALIIAFTFIYASILGGAAGILVAPIYFVAPGMGTSIALKAFAASIIGGFGNTVGAIIGGLAIGIIETLGAAYISEPYKDAYAFVILILFLFLRPQGIFGEKIAEKA
ncbi:branched-chain amino acid ABC transporter permease [Alicyclobacillus tolerans]|uniref:branched-chain amino acid ABC transporter permease n=1 Tax=Alicyclobacillus tolerans TaxID=90970 RepID=UPI001F3D164E|nr:branched-chain amino acid ABC transporter permease [Alicyclobacillus tolerans]MCF8565583.1 branched-chain amino acid ABC transporter permease [Alicyclobacillus tolerans]